MVNFDYNIHPVVGKLNISQPGYGNIKVYGFMDGETFIKLSTADRRSIFKPNGSVFASKTIQRDYYDLDNSIVLLYVTPNTNKDGGNDYVWNYEYEVEPIGIHIVELNVSLGQDGGKNYSVLASKGLLSREEDVFIHSGDKLYYIKGGNDSQIIPFLQYDESLPIVGGYPDDFFIGKTIPQIEGYADTASDERIVEWFFRLIKKNWADIQTGSGRAALLAAREALISMKDLPVSIALSRFERLQSLVDTFVISRDSLSVMAKSPWFKPSVDAAVARYKEDYLGTVKKEYQKELEELQKAHKVAFNEETKKHEDKMTILRESFSKEETQYEDKIALLNGHISDAQIELDQLVSDIEQKRQELDEVQDELNRVLERKDDIINDFKVVREVLGLSAKAETSVDHPQVSINLTSTNYSEKRLLFYKGYENNIENCLKLTQTKVTSISELAKLHARYGVLLLPNADVAMAIVAAAGRVCYHIAYVSVAWKSFNDVWNAGLQQIVTHCIEKPDIVHYFILRNINLSCLSNYLQPLADMMAGFSDTFPNTEINFPDNLRILLTVSEEDLIPLSEGIIQYFGCAPKSIETKMHGKISYANATYYGYLDANLLFAASKEIEEPSNYFAEYVDE